MYVEKLSITNFRCFEKTELELNYPGRRATKARPVPHHLKNVNLFLGSNGSGKSSVFKALVLGVLAPVIRSSSGFTAEYLVRRTPEDSQNVNNSSKSPPRKKAIIEAWLHLDAIDAKSFSNGSHRIVGQTSIQRIGDIEEIVSTAYNNPDVWEYMFFNDSPAFFMAGYGANRRSEHPDGYSEKNRTPRYQRVASLFEDHVGLLPFTNGYWNLQNLGYLDEAREILNGLLPDGVELTRENDQTPQFRHHDILLPFSALSDGFRTFVGWVWDLLLQLARVQSVNSSREDIQSSAGQQGLGIGARISRPKDKPLHDIPGVVIVDEIDLFLHPEWQRHVIEKIADAFPKIQFYFSTHSPLVAGTLEPENIFVMETDSNGVTVVDQYQENIHGLTANQVLTSSYFGLSSTRAPDTEMDEMTKLALSGNEADRQEFARRMAAEIPTK